MVRIAGLIVGTLIAGSASAADMPIVAPKPAPPEPRWVGWYIGGNAGWVFGTTEVGMGVDDSVGRYFTFPSNASQGANVAAVQTTGSGSFHNSGFIVGGQLGRRVELNGGFLVGAEVDVNYFNPKGSRTVTGIYPGNNNFSYAFNQSSSGGLLSTLRGQVAYALGNWAILYGTAGLAIANLSFSSAFADNTTAPPLNSATLMSNFSNSDTEFGWAAGGGGELAIDQSWSVGAQYLYVSIDGPSGGVQANPTTGTNRFFSFFNYTTAFREHIVRGTINYKFGS
jgi:outer membrane immunogenic protein